MSGNLPAPMMKPVRGARRPNLRLWGALIAGLLSAAAAPAHAWYPTFGPTRPEPEVNWGYRGDLGPEHWSDLSPDFSACKGEHQSPVDLRGGRLLRYSPLTFRYRSNPLSLTNDGRSVRVGYRPGSYMVAGGREYELTGFHFHVPGEHRINGVPADMELQLEHRDRQGRRAVVAVLMKAGRRMNSTLSRIWEHLPGRGGQTYYGRQKGINPLFLLPSDRSYFSYVGSMTEPPCTEGVEWFVLAEPVEVDQSYIHRLAQVVGSNARPVQPLNGRPVLTMSRR
ncbi:MAG: carbonic anhydrase family protein [Pseudomonadota bacterium]|nr:carbonic anhydrase family protein [Pseudomonadota bacterium]